MKRFNHLAMKLAASAVAVSFAAALATFDVSAQEKPAAKQTPHLAKPTLQELPTSELLDRLFARLHRADDAKSAERLENAIWNLWSHSPSPTATALLGQASKAMKVHRYPVARSILDTLIEQKPDFAEAWNKRATLYFFERDFDRALADIDKVLDLEPRHFGALSGLGMIRRELGDDRGALKAFRRALAIHPHLSGAKRAVKQLETTFEQKI